MTSPTQRAQRQLERMPEHVGGALVANEDAFSMHAWEFALSVGLTPDEIAALEEIIRS